jgi:hypothetical protein
MLLLDRICGRFLHTRPLTARQCAIALTSRSESRARTSARWRVDAAATDPRACGPTCLR